MFIPLGIRTDYSLLSSLIKIKELISFLKEHNITTCGILDLNLYGVGEFYNTCLEHNIKPIIGLDVMLNDHHLYLYAKNYRGYQNLIKLNTIVTQRPLSIQELKKYQSNLITVLPMASQSLYQDISSFMSELYLGYWNDFEKKNALIISQKIVWLNQVLALKSETTKYLNYLKIINEERPTDNEYANNYFIVPTNQNDIKTTIDFAALIDLKIPTNPLLLPKYDEKIKDSWSYLANLSKKGLEKRLPKEIPPVYLERLKYELAVIQKMGFEDYFLIVYDYVKYAKKNNILVGPGRGSAAGSLVSYVLGITNVDPIKYQLLFERFLNPDRVTLPDIDLDFEFTKREQVINYIKERYGNDQVALIMTYGTLSSKQVIRDVGKCLELDSYLIDQIANLLDPKLSLKMNLRNPKLKTLIDNDEKLHQLFVVSLHLEGLKRHISTHAAGIVIANQPLENIIPIAKTGEMLLTGITMDYLEQNGLLKMDLLALKNLTIIQNVIELIYQDTKQIINLNELPLDDQKAIKLFNQVETTGIFQFETNGMKNFLTKLKPTCFADIIAATALFRPGPMENIDTFIKRKTGQEKITYLHPLLETILTETYGIIVYQEQIMQILVAMGGYTYAEADNIRRAMSKKKKEVIEHEKEIFVAKAIKQGIKEEIATNVYDLILKFANYGFNKAHSVPYALISYQMAYLKSNYPEYFMANLLNMNIGSDLKTKEYLDEIKKYDIKILKPDINQSTATYQISSNGILLPLNSIKNIGENSVKAIVDERIKNGLYQDYFDFIARLYKQNINRQTIEYLIDGGAFNSLAINRQTLLNNLDRAITYAELSADLDANLIMKPALEIFPDDDEKTLIQKELKAFGFYLSNHPCSKYQTPDIIKLINKAQFFDKYIKTVVIIERIKKIKTKKNEEMAFITASDETASAEFIIFPKNNHLLTKIAKDDMLLITGQVTKRINEYQIIVSSIEEIKEDKHE